MRALALKVMAEIESRGKRIENDNSISPYWVEKIVSELRGIYYVVKEELDRYDEENLPEGKCVSTSLNG